MSSLSSWPAAKSAGTDICCCSMRRRTAGGCVVGTAWCGATWSSMTERWRDTKRGFAGRAGAGEDALRVMSGSSVVSAGLSAMAPRGVLLLPSCDERLTAIEETRGAL